MEYRVALNNKALNFRYSNGIGPKDPINLFGLLNKLNILTLFKPLTGEISGIAGKISDLKFILVNSTHSIGRQNFTIAHELYHLYFDETFKNTIIDFNNQNSIIEKKANIFASFLLLPDGFIDLIPDKEQVKNKISVPTIVKIEQYYQCSRTALLLRLEDLKLIDDEYKELLKVNILNQARILGYDTSLYSPGNTNKIIGNYAAMAKKLYDNEIISESNLIDFLLDTGIDSEDLDFNVYTK